MAFLNRAVAISSMVRVILRILRIDLRRLSRARAFAIAKNALSAGSHNQDDEIHLTQEESD